MIPRILRADALGLMRCSCSGRAAAASSLGASAASKAGAAGLCSRAASTQGAAATQPAGFLRRPGGSLQFWNAAGAGVVSRGMATQVSAEAPSSLARVGVLTRAKELLSDYKQLGKFKLSLLVVSTAAGGYVMGSGEHIDWRGLGWTCLGTMGAAASANTFNQVQHAPIHLLITGCLPPLLPSFRRTDLPRLSHLASSAAPSADLRGEARLPHEAHDEPAPSRRPRLPAPRSGLCCRDRHRRRRSPGSNGKSKPSSVAPSPSSPSPLPLSPFYHCPECPCSIHLPSRLSIITTSFTSLSHQQCSDRSPALFLPHPLRPTHSQQA